VGVSLSFWKYRGILHLVRDLALFLKGQSSGREIRFIKDGCTIIYETEKNVMNTSAITREV